MGKKGKGKGKEPKGPKPKAEPAPSNDKKRSNPEDEDIDSIATKQRREEATVKDASIAKMKRAAVETGETIRSIHCPIVAIVPQGRNAAVDLPDWHTGQTTDVFKGRFALPLRNQSFLNFKGCELHASEAFILRVAVFYRATWEEAVSILNNPESCGV